MLPATEQEKTAVTEYYLSQSPGAEVTFFRKSIPRRLSVTGTMFGMFTQAMVVGG
jgi:hypothetical protein